MPYPALGITMLISTPSDIPHEDLATVARTVSQWNVAMGRASNAVVVPISWSEHAVAAFGERPQAVLNEQLVDIADMALVLFADRLGTPTGEAESGTLEELELMVAAGKPVCVLVNRGPRPLSGTEAVAEKQRLESAIEDLQQRAIVLPYANHAELVGRLNNMLSQATGKVAGSSSAVPITPVGHDEAIGVWPTVARENIQETDSKGRLKTRIKRSLVLTNRTGRPVENVHFTVPEGVQARVTGVGEIIGTMGPGQDVRYALMMLVGVDNQFDVKVSWAFPGDEPRTTVATVRL